MKKVLSITALLAMTASYATAQTELTDAEAIEDKITEVEDSVADDFDRSSDDERYTGPSYSNTWSGSVSLTGTMNTTTENDNGVETDDDNTNFSIGARLNNSWKQWEQSLGVFYNYSQENDADAETAASVSYDISRSFTPRFYGFGAITASTNSAFENIDHEGYVALGAGYRILNDTNMAWRVQAGPAYQYTYGDGEYETSGAGAYVASRFFYKLSGTANLTNDTEYLFSEDRQSWSNDFGVNFKVTDNLNTRLGYLYKEEVREDIEYDSTKGQFTVSAVLSF